MIDIYVYNLASLGVWNLTSYLVLDDWVFQPLLPFEQLLNDLSDKSPLLFTWGSQIPHVIMHGFVCMLVSEN
jgi:hypothetical protein